MGFFEWLFGKKKPSTETIELIVTTTTTDDTEYDTEESDPDKDAWEGAFWDAANPIAVKAKLELKYTDANGNNSTRVVDVREFDEELYSGILIGHCHLRNATRTFRFDRIQSCVNLETGEEIQNICAFLRDKYERSPEATFDKLLTSHKDVLRALLFLAKADGRFTAKEREEILSYVKTLSGDERLDAPNLKKLFRSINIPSILAFKQCCGRISKNMEQGQRKQLIATAERMVATEKKVSPAEQEALDYMHKRLA